MSCSQTSAPLASPLPAPAAGLCPPEPGGVGVTPPAAPPPAAATEVRLAGGGRIATRLAPAPSPPHLARDDGYFSSDSTPKASGERRVAGVLPHPRGPPVDASPLAGDANFAKPAPDADGAVGGESVPVAAVAPRTPTAAAPAATGPAPRPARPDVADDGRESWAKSMDFLLSIIGFAVDLANVWRFPFLCYRNGGGAFLLPYFLITMFGALPLFFMELVLGQYNRQGPITVWKVCPLFRGVGYCAVLVAYFVSFYYNVIIAWSIYFVYASFSYELPWTSCNHTWNTDNCWDGLTSEEPRPNSSSLMSPSEEYFKGSTRENLSLFKGVKSSGKVVWVTATMPYVILTLLLIRGALLPGAADGLLYYIKPSISALYNPQVWYEAAVQVFFSVGAGFGVHLSYASYNNFNNNCYRDCLITSLVNAFTSFYSGLVIFTYLGYMAFKQKTHISTVATDGPGLVFQVYPEAVATLPGSQFWSCLFFLMLIALGLDSGMGGLECVITGMLDELRRTFGRKTIRREIFTAIVVSSSFLVSIANFCQGGMYVFHWLDTYAAGISLLCSALFEAIAISWFYGLRRFCADIQHMLGFVPRWYWRVCWKFVSPLFILITILIGLQSQITGQLEYNGPTHYQYPSWAEAVGWIITSSPMLMIPLWMVITVYRQPGSLRQKLLLSITPEGEHQKVLQTDDTPHLDWSHWCQL
nr:sodium-dependent noradrenaline transporter-like [Procambarus clarkii]